MSLDLLPDPSTSKAYRALEDFDKAIAGAFVLLGELDNYLASIGHTERFERWLEARSVYQELKTLMENEQ